MIAQGMSTVPLPTTGRISNRAIKQRDEHGRVHAHQQQARRKFAEGDQQDQRVGAHIAAERFAQVYADLVRALPLRRGKLAEPNPLSSG